MGRLQRCGQRPTRFPWQWTSRCSRAVGLGSCLLRPPPTQVFWLASSQLLVPETQLSGKASRDEQRAAGHGSAPAWERAFHPTDDPEPIWWPGQALACRSAWSLRKECAFTQLPFQLAWPCSSPLLTSRVTYPLLSAPKLHVSFHMYSCARHACTHTPWLPFSL